MRLHHLAVAGGVAWLTTHWLRGGFAPAGTPPEGARSGGDSTSGSADPADQVHLNSTDGGRRDSGSGSAKVASSPLEAAQAVEDLRKQERPALGFPSTDEIESDLTHSDGPKPGLSNFARGA